MGNYYCAPVVSKVLTACEGAKNKKQRKNEIQDELKAAHDDIISYFENTVLIRDLINSMAVIDAFCCDIEFDKHYFKNGDTPIHYAVRLHNAHFLIYLLQKGYNVNIKNDLSGDTPLHVAVKHSDMSTVGILLKFGADVNIKNFKDKTVKHIAKKNNDFELIYMFNNFKKILGLCDIMSDVIFFVYILYINIICIDNGPKITDITKNIFVDQHPIQTLSEDEDIDVRDKSDRDDNTILLTPFQPYNPIGIDTGITPMAKAHKKGINGYFILPPPKSPSNTLKIPLSPLISPANPSVTTPQSINNGINTGINAGINTGYTKVPPIGSVTPIDIITNCLRNLDDNQLNLYDKVWLYNVEEQKYEKQYLFLKDYHLIFHHKNKKYNSKGTVNVNELRHYDGFIHVFLIKYIDVYRSNKNNESDSEFCIYTYGYGNSKSMMKNPGKFLFKTDSKLKRNQWIEHLSHYCSSLSNTIKTLQNCDIQFKSQ